MNFSMKCKSFPLLAYDEIQSFTLKIKKNKILLFRGAYRIQKWPASNPWAEKFKFLKFSLRVA